jgi:hypothetical protein
MSNVITIINSGTTLNLGGGGSFIITGSNDLVTLGTGDVVLDTGYQ